ncbi:uncharacterized protein LOC125665437 isoform X2 [Ostrea edulis]|nr:uncharacterized protein LOC125665437 isoform X2 [Ostrea edulis]XP_056007397.1 uncharacterized protein LOC125665437 isoform X2 [Ostrea edulis]
MVVDKLHKMLSFGYCDKVPVGNHQPIGRYGNGFKSGSMRLGKDAIVFSRCKDMMSVGLLSQTYLKAIKAETVMVPIISWDLPSKTRKVRPESKNNLLAICSHSIFKDEKELLSELDFLENFKTGTRIIIYNLTKNNNSENLELDFDSAPLDIRNPESHLIDYTTIDRIINDKSPEYKVSLREYCSILYLKPSMKIFLRGKKVNTKFISRSLSETERDTYKPTWLKKPVNIKFGFISSKNPEDYGLMLYHNNRLIRAYEKVGYQKQANELGVGIVGVVEVFFLTPTHNKQDFSRDEKYNAFMSSAGKKLNEYWDVKRGKQCGTAKHQDVAPDWLWVHCDECLKWRRLPAGSSKVDLPENWYCYMNPDASFNRCEIPEEPEDEVEALKGPNYKKRFKKQQLEQNLKMKCHEEQQIKEKEVKKRKKSKSINSVIEKRRKMERGPLKQEEMHYTASTLDLGKRLNFSNSQQSDPGLSTPKLEILGEARLDSAGQDVLSSEHENTSSGDDMSDDDTSDDMYDEGKTHSEEIKPLKGTSKHGSWSTNKPTIPSHGKTQPHSSGRLGKTQKDKKKCVSFLKGKTKKYPYTMTEEMIKFGKKVEELREIGEVDIRIDSLVNSLNIETKSCKFWRRENIKKDYGELICNLDYLDCAGLDVGITMKPFNQYIEPFDGRRVNDFQEWMKDCTKVLNKTRSTQLGSVSSILFAIYAKEAILEFKPTELPGIIDYSIRCAIESNYYLLAFAIVRTYIFDHVIQLQRIFEGTKGISPLIIDIIIQTSRNMILRKFPNLQNKAIVLSFCWECGQGILTRMVMIMSYKGSIEITDKIPDEVMGFKLVLYNLAHLSDEAAQVFKSIPVSKKTPLPTVTESEARELFRKHSNLTMISASPYKSVGYSKGKHRVVEKLCISLFCLHKGYIPYGEEQFPKKIRDVEVDVQEGYCYFGAGRSLELGGHIKRLMNGSIGGFVDLPNSKVGLITCAHVVFSSEQLMMLRNGQRPSTDIEVEAFDKGSHSYKVCGKCIHADFPHVYKIGNPHLFTSASKDPNVDVALIEVHEDINTFEFRTVPSEQLQSAGFDPTNPPVFSGEVASLPDPDPVHKVSGQIPNKLDSVVKYGAVTGFTIGNLYHSHAHVRFVQESLKLPGDLHCAVMCDQIEIQNLPHGQFFVCGDSGSFVFCINPDKTLSCLGMAVGVSTRESCLVTPIDRILDNLRSVCPSPRLKPCSSLIQQTRTNAPPQATLDRILAAIGNFQTSLQNVETNFQTSLQNVERNVESVQASLQNVERNVANFQASLQNVQTEVQTLQSHVKQTEDSKTQSLSNQSSANQN